MKSCKQCGSHAINPHRHGRDNTDLDLCDVCYWRTRAETPFQADEMPVTTSPSKSEIGAKMPCGAVVTNVYEAYKTGM